ncbi:PD-(D/E)XK motif protein [Undibacterium sp. Ren11W]|uniref:PD-(D/E)XK motif protein n=1 Tax=Undibacterium sp. Ren11W TaxID=3413045 RepID=UPI003BF403B0
MANKFDTRWDALGSDPLRAVFQLYDADHLMDFYLGKDADNFRLLLLVTPEIPPTIRDMRAIRIRSFKRDDGKWSLLLTLENMALAPMFSMLCEDLIESSRSTGFPADKSLSYVLKRLGNWRRLLEHGMPDMLNESEIRGLCGELLFLQHLSFDIGKSNAVKAWVGPQKANQDFQIPESAWEIKTIRPDANRVTISSESQLQTNTRVIHLVVYELADSAIDAVGAFTLATLVEEIRALLAEDYDSSERFEANLATADYISRVEYGALTLIKKSMSMFVVGDGFPCITGAILPQGVSHVVYDICLSECEKHRIDTTSFAEKKDHP